MSNINQFDNKNELFINQIEYNNDLHVFIQKLC